MTHRPYDREGLPQLLGLHIPQPDGLVPEPLARISPSGLKATEIHRPECPRKVASASPLSHPTAGWSCYRTAGEISPSGLKATNIPSLHALHMCAPRSWLAHPTTGRYRQTSRWRSKSVRAEGHGIHPGWVPVKVCASVLACTSHSRMVLSDDPLASKATSGLKATQIPWLYARQMCAPGLGLHIPQPDGIVI